jgi:flagellum-specific peptidoglycan hydrolase FlgJ
MTREDFIEYVASVAVKDWKERRIMLPSVVIAQACKESSFGESELAKNANAIFGIKLNGWTGDSYRKKADEQNADGSMRTDENCLWRKYKSWEESILDHTDYIAERRVGKQVEPNYKEVIGEANVKKVIAGLVGNENRQATADRCTDLELRQYILDGGTDYGYHTGLNYSQSLLDDYIIKYNLTKYDKTRLWSRCPISVFYCLIGDRQIRGRNVVL